MFVCDGVQLEKQQEIFNFPRHERKNFHLVELFSAAGWINLYRRRLAVIHQNFLIYIVKNGLISQLWQHNEQ